MPRNAGISMFRRSRNPESNPVHGAELRKFLLANSSVGSALGHNPSRGECRSPISRILSALLVQGWTVISLTPPERSAPLARDATNTRRVTGGPPFSCSVLHHAGFAVPPWLPVARWALTPPFHPCLCPCGPSAVCFLLHFPSASLATAGPCFHKARCPMVSGLSSSTLAHTCDRPGSGVRSVGLIGRLAKENFSAGRPWVVAGGLRSHGCVLGSGGCGHGGWLCNSGWMAIAV
jgi:hypothetical protein